MTRSKILDFLIKKGVLISADAKEILENLSKDQEDIILKELTKLDVKILEKVHLESILKIKKTIIKKENIKLSFKYNNSLKVSYKKSSKKIIKVNKTLLDFLNKEDKTNIEDKELDNKDSNLFSIKDKKEKELKSININDAVLFKENKKVKHNFEDYLKEKENNEYKKEDSIIINPFKLRYAGEEYDLKVKIIKNYKKPYYNITPELWAEYYKLRLNKIKSFIRQHSEYKNIVSSAYLGDSNEELCFVGLLRNKKETTKGIVLIVEDNQGLVKVFYSKENPEFDILRDAPLDCVIGFRGYYKNKMFFANEYKFPDIPIQDKKTCEEEVYAIFTGDFQVGSNTFLEKEFKLFIRWLKGEYGNQKMRELAKKVGYLIVPGDIVDGVGIYPDQKSELLIYTIEEQYKYFEELIMEIPEWIQVILIPGNHDVVRLAEPQPPIPKEFLERLYELNNFYILSNPSYVQIHDLLDILIYHGYSMDWYVSNVSWIRNQGGYENPGNIMKFMLMMRHLAPQHGSTPYIPTRLEDALVIDRIPNIFVTGHIHRTFVGNYKGVDLINASCFQDITQFQIETGHKPDPGKVIIKNLKTGKLNILDFYTKN